MNEKIKILYLCDDKYWKTKMSRVRFHAVDAIFRHKNILGFKDGPGFPEWKNVPHSVKKYNPDIIFWFKPLSMDGYNDIDTPKIISYNEMYDFKNTSKEIIDSDSRLIICHLANDIPKYESLIKKNFIFKNIPHSIEKTVFKDYNQKKIYDVLLTGVMSEKIYPLRCRVKNIIKDKKFKNFKVKIMNHPGYRILDVNSQVVDYAKEINKAKISITCSSIYKYALAKYSEIPACNSLLIADLPNERPDFFNKFIVPIDISDSDNEIIEKIFYWLNNDDERILRSRMGMDLTLSEYTQEKYADKFYSITKDFLENLRK